MTNAELAALLTDRLEADAGSDTTLVSMELIILTPAEPGSIETRVARRTKTLLFQHADLLDAQGYRIASASSVHRLAQ